MTVATGGEALPFGTPVVSATTVIVSCAVGTLVTLAAAFVPARRAARIPPVAALREGTAAPGRCGAGSSVPVSLLWSAVGSSRPVSRRANWP